MTNAGDHFASLGGFNRIVTDPAQARKLQDIKSFVEGRFRGHRVAWQPSAQTMIEAGAEEAGAFGGEKLADRLQKVRQRRKGEELHRLISTTARFYIEKIPDLGPEKKLMGFYRELAKNDTVTKEGIAKQASDTFADRTLQFAGLTFVGAVLSRQPGFDRLKQSIDSELNNLMGNHGPEIRAGMNISANAAVFSAQGLGEINALRSFYQKIILSHTTINETYEAIVQQIDKIDFSAMFKFVATSAAADLKAAVPSISRAKLRQCINDMERLGLIQGLHREAADLLGGLQDKYGVDRRYTVAGLFKHVLTLFFRPFTVNMTLEKMISELAIKDLAPLIYLFFNLKRLIRLAPDKAFARKRDRPALMGTVQEELDRAANLEKQ